jgi:tRNA-dihydrouridine synthase C
VRDAVPQKFPVSAKLRLGFDDPKAIYENARRTEQAGANWIAIHGRTKTQGYTPPAYWKPIGEVKRALSIPVIANGEIFSLADFKQCREETESIHFMIGRGALANPSLPRLMREALGLPVIEVPDRLHLPEDANPKSWAKTFQEYALVQPSEKRIKQWVRYLASKQNVTWWDQLKAIQTTPEIISFLDSGI